MDSKVKKFKKVKATANREYVQLLTMYIVELVVKIMTYAWIYCTSTL